MFLCFTLKHTFICVYWWTRQRIHNTLIVVDRYVRLVGDKTIPDSAEPRLESFYPPFVAGIDLPHQGVVGSYNLYNGNSYVVNKHASHKNGSERNHGSIINPQHPFFLKAVFPCIIFKLFRKFHQNPSIRFFSVKLLTDKQFNSDEYVTGEFPAQRPVTRSFHVFFDLRLDERLNKQSRGWWFETPSRSLWRHRNDILYYFFQLLLTNYMPK